MEQESRMPSVERKIPVYIDRPLEEGGGIDQIRFDAEVTYDGSNVVVVFPPNVELRNEDHLSFGPMMHRIVG